ncbi:sugar phosphate isomerase/epimerase family protein [Natronorubrum halophilum]|uniref:sugar phosphate isomerase/epimerase family protein n=1 Tax=Natronorubrum halophilum TaxID=1702106 RepID=UPI0010C2164D|nr:sugar phosphate isomerase/epimerase family protein [Natronorubrum halophilum]
MTPSVGAAMDIRFGETVEEFMRYVTDLGLDHVEFKREYLAGHPETPGPERIRELSNSYGVSVTYHAPFRDWNIGSYNEVVRQNSVERAKRTLDDAAEAGAGAVVVHGGSVPKRYPEWVRDRAKQNALRSLAECAEYAQLVGVPLCLENQPINEQKRRYTTTPADLASMRNTVDVPPKYLGVTLDVGHAKVNGYDWRAFVEEFGHRIRVCHLHDNDGTADQHEPFPDYESVVESIPADYFVFEMKSVGDLSTSVGTDKTPLETEPTVHE